MSKMTAESKLLVESGRCVALEFASPRHVMVTMTETGVNSLTLFLRSQDDIDTIQRALATASVQLNHATPIREAAQGTAAANVVPASPSSSGAEPSKDATAGTGTAGAACPTHHFVKYYGCGHEHSQCQCTSPDKEVTRLDIPCDECKGASWSAAEYYTSGGCCDWGREP